MDMPRRFKDRRDAARLLAGALARYEDSEGALVLGGHYEDAEGFYIEPTIFADVKPEARIAREEIFGPVLSIMSYKDEDDAVKIANDTVYGLAAYVQSKNLEHARDVAGRLRAGQVSINYPEWDTFAPFGGYKQSGNGREGGMFGLEDFLEVKTVHLPDAA